MLYFPFPPTVHTRLLSIVFLPLLGSVAAGGCGARPDRWAKDRPPTYPARGVVTFAGEPVAGATVVLTSADHPLSACGFTDARGRFTLRTFAPGDGAVEGRHGVRIEKYKEDFTKLDAPAVEYGAKTTRGIPLLPERYAEVETSGFTAEVSPRGSNTFRFDLKP